MTRLDECKELQHLNDLIDIKIKEYWKIKRIINRSEDKLRILERDIRELENQQKTYNQGDN